MTLPKSLVRVSVLSSVIALVGICQVCAATAAKQNHASKGLQASMGMKDSKDAQKPFEEDIDTFFAKMKTAYDKMVLSPVLKSAQIAPVNGFFMNSLKGHQPWHSLIRTDKKGQVINEVIRIEGVSKEKRSVADQPWFAEVNKKPEGYTGFVGEKNGRYYLLWAAPIVTKVKGKETFAGAVALQVDIWDCFDRFSNKTTTPFSVRVNQRLTLFDHLWKDTIRFVEKPLSVAGVDLITVRYPKPASEAMADAAAARVADSLAREKARIDSLAARAVADSLAKAAQLKKAKSRTMLIVGIVVLLAIVLLVLIARLVTLVKNQMRMRQINKEGRNPFDRL